ncbi:MAG TPA: site-specific DNA-methyltransferase [Kofleriaceae bacterium]|nr:site-specific DNA-methyltransferase [Kofleriaceae bacterium]
MLERRISFGHAGARPDRLTLGDNLPVLAAMGDGSVDLIYVDPPFGTGLVRRGRDRQYRDVPDSPEDLVGWMGPRLEHARRVLGPGGSLFVHLDYRSVHYVKVALDRLFGRSHFINEIIWCYSVGGKSRRTFGRKHDTILWYARTPDYAFYPDAVRVPRRGGSHMRVVLNEHGQPVQEKTDRKTGKVYRYPVEAGKVPEDWWTDIETLNRSAAERTGWPDQKPERLLERLIAATTTTGNLIVDFFGGSGTTAVVAQRLGRHFALIDQEPTAIACAATRLERAGHALAAAGTPPPDLVIEAADQQPTLRGLATA